MAGAPAGLPAGIRLSDHISLGVIARAFPLDRVREVLEAQYLKRPMLDGPAATPYAGRRDHVGVYPQ